MIALFFAMKGEADPYIDALGLKGAGDISGFKIYSDDTYILCVTGMGKVNSACAVTRILSLYEGKIDIAVNIGTCAGEDVGRTYIINRICDIDSGRDLYPDMLYKSPFVEISLHTSDRYKKDSVFEDDYGPYVYDMEGAAFFISASNFLSPDRILLFKTVSDPGDPDIVTADYCRSLLEPSVQDITALIGDIVSSFEGDPYLAADTMACKYSEELHCSEYMRNDLNRLIRYALSSGVDIASYIDERLPIRDRIEGKKVLEDVRKMLL
ncbi:Nucleoside phosphorylase [Oscillospiraceae bacterium]|nr:Nucleoside phosphorylase [Oscillospiraceae bacterium]